MGIVDTPGLFPYTDLTAQRAPPTHTPETMTVTFDSQSAKPSYARFSASDVTPDEALDFLRGEHTSDDVLAESIYRGDRRVSPEFRENVLSHCIARVPADEWLALIEWSRDTLLATGVPTPSYSVLDWRYKAAVRDSVAGEDLERVDLALLIIGTGAYGRTEETMEARREIISSILREAA